MHEDVRSTSLTAALRTRFGVLSALPELRVAFDT